MRFLCSVLILLTMVSGPVRAAEPLTIAVASNFTSTAQALSRAFTEHTGHSVTVIQGSTGKLYAQIRRGAPFDLFLAADAERPGRLLPHTAAASRTHAYAHGRLALWAPRYSPVSDASLRTDRRLAIANARLAPYGRAARAALQSLDLWPRPDDRLVIGNNIAQTYQFVDTGAADMGLVAYSQVLNAHLPESQYWLVPETLHAPIAQEAIVLTDHPQARAFLAFMKSQTGRELIRRDGYEVPSS